MRTSPFSIPLTDVHVSEEDVEAVLGCLRSGWLTMGPRIQAFEEAFAEWVGVEHAVAVGCGTAALHLALRAVDVGPGDEVIVPAFTFVASAGAVRHCGAEPVIADAVSPNAPNLDPGDVLARLTPRTKAIMPAHMMGYAAETELLRTLCAEHGLTLVEDAAQAVGARTHAGQPVGTVGAAGCFSFFSKKQLTTGEGGMVITNDRHVAARVRSLRSHAMTSVTWDRHRGHAESYDIVDVGFNFRMDEPRAALGLSRLGRLDDSLAARRAAVRAYRERLAGVDGLELMWDDEAVERATHFCFAVLLPDRAARDDVRVALTDRGIQTTWYPSLTSFTEYAGAGSRPRAEEAADRHVALPLSSSTGEDEVEAVVAALRDAL